MLESRCRAYVAQVIYVGLQTTRTSASEARVSVFEAAYFVLRYLFLLRSLTAAPQTSSSVYDLYRSRSLASAFFDLHLQLRGERLRMIPLRGCRKTVYRLMEEHYQSWQPRLGLHKQYDLGHFLLFFYTPEHTSDPVRQFLLSFLSKQ